MGVVTVAGGQMGREGEAAMGREVGRWGGKGWLGRETGRGEKSICALVSCFLLCHCVCLCVFFLQTVNMQKDHLPGRGQSLACFSFFLLLCHCVYYCFCYCVIVRTVNMQKRHLATRVQSPAHVSCFLLATPNHSQSHHICKCVTAFNLLSPCIAFTSVLEPGCFVQGTGLSVWFHWPSLEFLESFLFTVYM